MAYGMKPYKHILQSRSLEWPKAYDNILYHTLYLCYILEMIKGCPELRAELERLTNPPGGAVAVRLEDQITEVARLHERYPHGITLEERASIARQRSNCVMYALGIEADEIENWCDDQRTHPGLDFLAWLVAERLIFKGDVADAQDGDIIVYRREDRHPMHVGVARGGQVISKWGSGGTHIWRHHAFEVPACYGHDPVVYEPISATQATLAFREWAAEPRL
jgi:hypothetical protein